MREHVAAMWGRVEMRSRMEALNGFGVSEVLILLTTISVPRAFNPTSQLFSKPREMPTSATTAAIPMEMPIERQSGSHSTSHQAAHHYRKKAHVSVAENRPRIGRPS